MNSSKIPSDDIRKTVQHNKKKKSNKLPIIIIMSIIIVAGIIYLTNILKNKKITLEEITEYNYFLISDEDKIGVIDKTGKVIIEPEYDYIQIPNPSKDVFVCLYDYNSSTKEYNSKVLNEEGKNILTKYSGIQAIANNNTSINNLYQTAILMYKENGKYGTISLDGQKITDAIYDSIETLEYKDGILKVSKDGLYGLIDLNGEEIVEPNYNSIVADGYYNENYDKAGYIVNIKTDTGYRYGYINYKGKQVLDTIYTNIKRITEIKNGEDFYLITYKNGQVGLIKNGQTVIENQYEKLEYDLANNIVMLQKNGSQGVYDLAGNMILPIQYDQITFMGSYINATKDGNLLVFDNGGTKMADDSYKSLNAINDGEYYITIDRNNNYGLLGNNKQVLINNEYSYMEYAFGKYFIVSKNGKSGVIDSDNNIMIEISQDVVQKIIGTNIIQTINSSTNTINLYNKELQQIFSQIDARIYIETNYIEVISKDNVSYFDYDGNNKNATEIFVNNKIFSAEKDGKWGYVDKEGNVIVDYIYDMTLNINKYGFGAIKLNDMWGVVSETGEIIKEPTYKLTDVKPQFIGEYYKINDSYGVDYYSNK